MLADFWLAGLPLLAALASLMLPTSHKSLLRILVAILFVSSFTLLLKEARSSIESRRLGKLAILLGFVGWYAWPAMFRLWSTSSWFDEDLPVYIYDDTVVLTVLYLALFLFTWLMISQLLGNKRLADAEPQPAPQTNSSVLVVMALLACAIGFIPYLVSGLSISEIIAAVGASRSMDKPWAYAEHLGNDTSPFLYLASSMRTAGAGLLLIAMQDRRVGSGLRFVTALVALVVTVLTYFDQGTRSVFAILVLPAVLLLFIKAWSQSKRRAGIVLLVSALVFFFALQYQLLFRSDKTRDEMSDLFFEGWTTLSGTTDYFMETALAVELVPTYHDFFRESALLQFVTSPIPRFVWAAKPIPQVSWYYTLMRWGVDIYTERGNVFPGIVGQYYMSWGWFGSVLLGIILAAASKKCDDFLSRASPLSDPYHFAVGAMLAVWLLITYRYLSPGFVYPVICAAGIVALSKLTRKRVQKMSMDRPSTLQKTDRATR